MRRTQVQLDEALYATLRRRAYDQGTSMASIIRESLSKTFGPRAGKRRPPRSLRRFSFVGAGRSDQKRLAPVSERHDEALAEALRKKTRR
ncbi:MAG: ribbon-helix-helix protein, CopG family [Acidobacteriota bacterium]